MAVSRKKKAGKARKEHARVVPPFKPSFRIDELAARWDCGERSVRRLIEKGKLKTFWAGGVRIKLDEVERYEAGQAGK